MYDLEIYTAEETTIRNIDGDLPRVGEVYELSKGPEVFRGFYDVTHVIHNGSMEDDSRPIEHIYLKNPTVVIKHKRDHI